MSLPAATSGWLRNNEWQRRVLLVATAAVAVSYAVGVLATAGFHRSFVKGDARFVFAFLPSLVIDRDVDLRNQFAVLKPEGDTDHPFGLGREGRARTPFPVSPALLWLPGYLAGLTLDRALKPLLVESQPFGYGTGAALGTALWSIFLAGAGLELTRRLVREVVGPAQALPAAMLSWIATSALYYTAISPRQPARPGVVRRQHVAVVHVAGRETTRADVVVGGFGLQWRARRRRPSPGCDTARRARVRPVADVVSRSAVRGGRCGRGAGRALRCSGTFPKRW